MNIVVQDPGYVYEDCGTTAQGDMSGEAELADHEIGDELLIPAVYAATAAVVAHAQTFGPLPALRSPEFLAAPAVVQQAVLLVCGCAWVINGDPVRAVLREVSHDVHGGDTGFWRAVADNHLPYTELQRRRAQPGPLARGAAA